MIRSVVKGSGSALPPRVVTNAELATRQRSLPVHGLVDDPQRLVLGAAIEPELPEPPPRPAHDDRREQLLGADDRSDDQEADEHHHRDGGEKVT